MYLLITLKTRLFWSTNFKRKYIQWWNSKIRMFWYLKNLWSYIICYFCLYVVHLLLVCNINSELMPRATPQMLLKRPQTWFCTLVLRKKWSSSVHSLIFTSMFYVIWNEVTFGGLLNLSYHKHSVSNVLLHPLPDAHCYRFLS